MSASPYCLFLCLLPSLFSKSAVINRAFLNPAICLLIHAKEHQRVDEIYTETALDMVGMLWLTHPFSITWILRTGHLVFQLITDEAANTAPDGPTSEFWVQSGVFEIMELKESCCFFFDSEITFSLQKGATYISALILKSQQSPQLFFLFFAHSVWMWRRWCRFLFNR